MSSINNQNLLSPLQTNMPEMNTVPSDVPTPNVSANAFGYDWFVLSQGSTQGSSGGNTLIGSTAIDSKANSAASDNNTFYPVNNTIPSSGNMESRIERIIQYILPGACLTPCAIDSGRICIQRFCSCCLLSNITPTPRYKNSLPIHWYMP